MAVDCQVREAHAPVRPLVRFDSTEYSLRILFRVGVRLLSNWVRAVILPFHSKNKTPTIVRMHEGMILNILYCCLRQVIRAEQDI